MITLPWYIILAAAVVLIILVLIARRADKEVAHLRSSRDQALADGRAAYARGHEDGLSDAYRRVDGMGANANSAYNNGYEAGKRDAAETRRNGRRAVSA